MKSETCERICIFLVLAALWCGVRWLRGDFEPPKQLVPLPHLQFNEPSRLIPLPAVSPRLGGEQGGLLDCQSAAS